MNIGNVRQVPITNDTPIAELNGVPGVENRVYELIEVVTKQPATLEEVGRYLEGVYREAIGPTERELSSGNPILRIIIPPSSRVWQVTRFFNDLNDAGILIYGGGAFYEIDSEGPSMMYRVENRTPNLTLIDRLLIGILR